MNKKWMVFVVISTLLYLLISVVVFVILGFYFDVADITGIGQLFADIILFPTVIIGFLITIIEFRKSQALPTLKLLWRGDMAVGLEKDCLVLETSSHNVKNFSLLLFVKNEGNAIATLYRLVFDIPHDLARPNTEAHSVRWHRGDENCWSSGVNIKMTRHEFKSNRQHALYPDKEEVHIATVEVQVFPNITYPRRVYIPYSIVTDKTQIQHGVCKIRVRPEDFTRKNFQM